MNSSLSVAKVWFSLSLLVLVFLYGVGVGNWGWFPYSIIKQAQDQLEIVSRRILPPSWSRDPYFVGPRPYDREGVRVVNAEKVQSGATLISSNWESFEWESGLKLIDKEGRTLHQWRVDPAGLSGASSGFLDVKRYHGGPHGTHLLENGDVIVNLRGGRGVARLNSCGELIWRLPAKGHHSIHPAEDGSIWISESRSTESSHAGLEKFSEVEEDIATQISKDGEIIDRISVLDIVFSSEIKRYVPKHSEGEPVPGDITHLNDVEPLPSNISDQYPTFNSGDVLVSLRRPDIIAVVDTDNGEIIWYHHLSFINQHDPDFIGGGGWIGVFDNNQDGTNRGNMLGGSRVVAIQPHTDSVDTLASTKMLGNFYTSNKGKWQLLDNGNMLLTEANAGRVVEVSPKGEVVWEWLQAPYSSNGSTVPTVLEGTRYDLTRADVASWSCSSVDSLDTSLKEQQTAP